jgi:uncharacterized protein (DUF433 family)
MRRQSWRSRISIDPRVCGGQACIRGTRVMISLLVDYLANGDTEEQILAAYPHLRREDLRAAMHYAAELTRERVIPVGVGA